MEVRLFATFRENREKIMLMDWYDDIDVYAVIEKLQISPDEVAICLINGYHKKLDTKLNNDDIIALFPPVGGG